MEQPIYEGTAQELAPLLAKHPQKRFRLTELPEKTAEQAKEPTPTDNAQNAASIALLKSWLEEDATDDPEEIRQAEEELREFKRNMNANRAATGERIPYPDVAESDTPS